MHLFQNNASALVRDFCRVDTERDCSRADSMTSTKNITYSKKVLTAKLSAKNETSYLT